MHKNHSPFAYGLLSSLFLCTTLSGCDWVNQVTGLSKDADKAIGAGCCQSGRSLEACYVLHPNADKAQIYLGWREMHEYMAKEKLAVMPPAAAIATPSATQQANEHSTATPSHPTSSNESADPEVQAVLDTINNRPHSSEPKANDGKN